MQQAQPVAKLEAHLVRARQLSSLPRGGEARAARTWRVEHEEVDRLEAALFAVERRLAAERDDARVAWRGDPVEAPVERLLCERHRLWRKCEPVGKLRPLPGNVPLERRRRRRERAPDGAELRGWHGEPAVEPRRRLQRHRLLDGREKPGLARRERPPRRQPKLEVGGARLHQVGAEREEELIALALPSRLRRLRLRARRDKRGAAAADTTASAAAAASGRRAQHQIPHHLEIRRTDVSRRPVRREQRRAAALSIAVERRARQWQPVVAWVVGGA